MLIILDKWVNFFIYIKDISYIRYMYYFSYNMWVSHGYRTYTINNTL